MKTNRRLREHLVAKEEGERTHVAALVVLRERRAKWRAGGLRRGETERRAQGTACLTIVCDPRSFAVGESREEGGKL